MFRHFLWLLLLYLLLLLIFKVYDVFANLVAKVRVKFVVNHGLKNDWSHVVDSRIGKQLQRWCKRHEFVVVGVVVPTDARDAVLRLKLVAVGRIINNDDILERSTCPLHIFHENVVVKATVLSEQTLRRYLILIKDVH